MVTDWPLATRRRYACLTSARMILEGWWAGGSVPGQQDLRMLVP